MQLEKDQEKQLLIAIKNEAKKRNIKVIWEDYFL